MFQQSYFFLKRFRELIESVSSLHILLLRQAYCFSLIVVKIAIVLGDYYFGAIIKKHSCCFV